MVKCPMSPGTRVKMSKALKAKLRASKSTQHLSEFGQCEGVVLGLTDYKTCLGPEVDVRWFPSGLRYAYHPDDLEAVHEVKENA
jgi:hypothetical protein